jgi:helicase MOV-10
LKASPHARIFACAPSNSAADVIAMRLLRYDPAIKLFRFVAPSRTRKMVPDEILPHTYPPQGEAFAVPGTSFVLPYSVVVSTCGSASFAYNINIPQGHFTHIFIDEASQGSEPEAMIPIKTMADSRTRIILSGDPKQLGPVIRSRIARQLGLSISYLERLIAREAYSERGDGHTWVFSTQRCRVEAFYNALLFRVVKLVQNYRSHPDIILFPNEKFYDGDLVSTGASSVTHMLEKWVGLPTPGFPIIFHAVSGNDAREASSPSYFNIDEITQVKQYVKLLLEDTRLGTFIEKISFHLLTLMLQ